MNYLTNRSVYLAGPISAQDDNGKNWRDFVTSFLVNNFQIHVEDPIKKTINGLSEIGDDKKLFKQLAQEEKWGELKKKFYPIVRKDLRCVDKSDFLIVYYEPNVPTIGTIHEIVEASHQKKPILIKYNKNQLHLFNPWLTCLVKSTWLFSDWSDMFKYLHEVNMGKFETSHWGLE